MSVRRDTPRGPTSEQLRRRALAHEQRANTERATAAALIAAGFESYTHTASETRGETMAPRDAAPAGDGSPGSSAGA